VFNHVGHCVADTARARRFYEEALGFRYWWSFEVPDDPGAPVLRVPPPMGLVATYLVHGSFVLELLEYQEPGARRTGTERTMSQPGLTHMSLSVPDLAAALAKVVECGGDRLEDTETDAVAFVRDPDGQLVELSTMGWRDILPPLPG
jgi:catechol 2,3-dioxygenase-like lactoylglutathione lyase family enzyme